MSKITAKWNSSPFRVEAKSASDGDGVSDPMTSGPSSAIATGPYALSRLVVLLMSVTASLGTATIYLLQPSVAQVANSLDSTTPSVGVALACGPVGYMIGLIALVPLVDRFPPRLVYGTQFFALAVVLSITAVVRTIPILGIVVMLTGAFSVVGAGMASIAGRLALPHRRATTLGVITAGISVGVLGGRIVGGTLADHLGWRGMLFAMAGACLVAAMSCALALPRPPGSASVHGYVATMRSIPGLFVRHSALRVAAVRGALWFFGFCALWSALAVALSQPPFSFSSERIGLFALAGLSGIAATQLAGVCTDRIGARSVILVGLTVTVVATVVIAVVLPSAAATVACLALFDAGLFAAQVANQSTVLTIDPAAPARFNSAYMTVYFVGGSAGTAFGAAAIGWFGWSTTALSIAAVIATAGVITALGSHTHRRV